MVRLRHSKSAPGSTWPLFFAQIQAGCRFFPKNTSLYTTGRSWQEWLLNSLKYRADMKDTDYNDFQCKIYKKNSYLDLFSSRNGCLFWKYCTGSFGRSNVSPAKAEPSQHMRADINTSLELHISRGSADSGLGILPRKSSFIKGSVSLPLQKTKGLCLIFIEAGAKEISGLFWEQLAIDTDPTGEITIP